MNVKVLNKAISKTQLDSLVVNVIGGLGTYGVDLDSDLAAELGGLLTDFIAEKCDIEIEPKTSSEEDEPITISFDIVAGSVEQKVRLVNADYDRDLLVEGLESGKLATTTWFKQGGTQVIEAVASGEVVAIVVSQEICGEYKDFATLALTKIFSNL